MSMISLKDVYKNFSGEYALHGITFDVSRGQILGFLGPNGAGKTTTMRIITGFLAPTSGSVTVGGMDIFKNPREIKRLIGYMPENNPLYTDLKVLEYLKFRGKLKGLRRAELKQRLEYVFDTCMLHDVADKLISMLSRGYRQRVGLAEALIHDPQILILDEPTVGLDPTQIRQVRELIKNIGRERTVILSTHILPEVEATCNSVIIINKGKIVAMESSEQLRKLHEGSCKITLEVRGNLTRFEAGLDTAETLLWNRTAQIAGDQVVYELDYTGAEDIRAELFHLAVSTDCILLEQHRQQMSLEDIFIDLVTDEKASGKEQV